MELNEKATVAKTATVQTEELIQWADRFIEQYRQALDELARK